VLQTAAVQKWELLDPILAKQHTAAMQLNFAE
jgi:hypothetical protein